MFDFMFALVVFNTAVLFASAVSHSVFMSDLNKKYDNILKYIDVLTDEQKRHFK